jgi:Putative MetA-pathway of phenol degradation
VQAAKVSVSQSLSFMRRLRAVPLIFLAATPAMGQWMGKQTDCYAASIAANPNRPTVADPADITQYGVLEVEYGWDRTSPDREVRQSSVGGLLKFGLLCDLEVRWSSVAFFSQNDASGSHRGFGDNWLGPQVRIYRQTKRVPTMAFSYAFKIPNAPAAIGGTGRFDHAITFLASKDLERFHFDFNVSHFIIGRANASGFDRNGQMNLAFSHPLYRGLLLTGEVYGATELSRSTSSYISSLWALTYTITPRLVVDGGFEAGLTSGGPRRHAFVGVTYAIANLYPGGRRSQSRSPDSP